MKCQDLFSLKIIINCIRLSSAAAMIGTLRVKMSIILNWPHLNRRTADKSKSPPVTNNSDDMWLNNLSIFIQSIMMVKKNAITYVRLQ